MVKSAKGKTNESSDSVWPGDFPLDGSVWRTHARLFGVERRKLWYQSTQNKRNKNNYVSPSVYNCDGPNLEWSVLLTRPCAARSTLVYLEMRDAPQCTAVHHLFRQLAISN